MNRWVSTNCKQGFSLIELLVVVSIIGVLAALLFPTLTKARERAKIATCTSNVRQIGLALKMYVTDYGKFPDYELIDEDKTRKWTKGTIGGFSPLPSHAPFSLSEGKRPLNKYLRPSRVFQCAADAGTIMSWPGAPVDKINHNPTAFGTVGCSYLFNVGPLEFIGGTYRNGLRKGQREFLAKKSEDWVASPSKYILIYEPTAGMNGGFNQWHNNRGRTYFHFSQVKSAPKLFISPVAFADGHVAVHNFSDAIQADPYYPHEETKDWIWYKPAWP
jgi:prepilin-type N-terminal cleavage/methylation domain-containing protein